MKKGNKADSIWNCLKNLNKLDRWKLPIVCGKAFFETFQIYINIFIISIVITLITAGVSFGDALQSIIIYLVFTLLFTVCSYYFDRINKIRNESCYRSYKLRKSKKISEMEFAELESHKIKKMLAQLHTEESYGFDLPMLFQSIESIIRYLFSAAASLILIIVFIPGGEYMTYFWVVIFSLVSSLLSVLLSSMTKKADQKSLDTIRSTFPPHIIINEYLTYGGGIQYKDGKDIRLYQYQDSIEQCYMRGLQEMRGFDKTGVTLPAVATGFTGAFKSLILCVSYMFVILLLPVYTTDISWILMLSAALYQLVVSLIGIVTEASRCIVMGESVNGYMQLTKTEEKAIIKEVLDKPEGFNIELRNISFQYPGTECNILKNITMNIKEGSRVALVGANGSGKTTLIKLLCGLYTPNEGEILIGGCNRESFSLEAYIENFSVVFQDFKLFSFSLEEVVAANASPHPLDVKSALAKAGFTERLDAMKNGLETYLYKDFEDGVEVSGGEAQKIALARMLYRDSPIYILDEPTAALDPLTEYEVYQHINNIKENKTILFISHRMSACRFSDQIIVLDHGEIVQTGTHEELLQQKDGLYEAMWNAQAQYYT